MTDLSARDAAVEAFRLRLDQSKPRVEAMLDTLLAPTPSGGNDRRGRLLDAMRYSVLLGGKRLRPFLLIETARALGVGDDGPLRAACAVELVHCYSLVHDDLPAMDDDDLRRGRPTTHRAFDEATAILAGDALLTLAFEVMADAPTHPDGSVRAALCAGLARASGHTGMAGGQMLDISAETATTPLERSEIARMQAMKTGALLQFSVEAGAMIASASSPRRDAFSQYGAAIGAAFQIADDLLDAESDAAALGKRAGKDGERNKATLVSILGANGARRELDRLVAEAQLAITEARLGEEGRFLCFAAKYVASRQN